MNSSLWPVVSVLVASIIIQATAAFMAIRLVHITGRKTAWCLIALVLVLMAVRRSVPLIRMLASDTANPPDLVNEIIGLALSICMAIGVSQIAPLFLDRIRNEQLLREKTEELDRYFTNALDLLCIADADGHFRRLNPQWEDSLGYKVGELEGRLLLDFVHPDDAPGTRQALARLSEQKEVAGYINRYRRKDGTYCWIEWRSYPAGTRIYSVARDITERKRAEAELEKLNRELEERVKERTSALQIKSDELQDSQRALMNIIEDLNEKSGALETANRELASFSYSVSHDLRAPLRIIDGFGRALLEDYADKLDDEGKRNLATIRTASQRMGLLIDDMLRLANLNRSELRWTSINLSRLIEDIAAELKQTDPERDVQFVVAQRCVVIGDASLLRIAMENILGNAWKYTSKKPLAKIEFGAVNDANGPVFFVRDNGCGFDMKYAKRLFGAFQRLHSAEEFPGTGIGLASVQRVIQRHGGRVWIEGELDRGTTVHFTLPKHL